MRSFFAIAAVLGSSLPGFVGTSASSAVVEPVLPSIGCWRYEPDPSADPDAKIDDITGIVDISTVLEPWAEESKLALATAGDTVVGKVRTFGLDVPEGPAVDASPVETEGSATYFLDVIAPDGVRTALDAITVDFTIPADTEVIPAMRATGSFKLALSGATTVILRSVYFDLPDLSERLACNGQPVGDAVTNPATTPLDTSVLASVTAVPTTGLAVTGITDQLVVNAARSGDEVQLALTGFVSTAGVSLGLCGPSTDGAATCGQTVDVTALADGSIAKSIVVPGTAVVGAGSVRARTTATTPEVVLDQPLRILGEPVLELAATSKTNRFQVTGAEWDPLKQVLLMAVDEAGDRVGETVKLEAGQTGRISARITVSADADVVAIVATQSHRSTTLEASADVSIVVADDDEAASGSGTDDSTGNDTSTDTSSAPAATETLPLDIPAPIDLPVTTVPGPIDGSLAGTDALAVTKVKLVGSTQLADLFGGGPERVLKLQVENISESDVIAPGLSIAVGKGGEVDPVYTSDGFGRLAAGESREIRVPISLPAGAFGVYTVSGQLGGGEAGAFTVSWETYPWGLFGLNGLGILLIAFAVRRRMTVPVPSRLAAMIDGGAVATGPDAGAAVIDLAVLERWWSLQATDDGARESVGADTMADAVVDVDAVERWLERCSARSGKIG